MAGTYIDSPNNRLAWDVDGTQLLWSPDLVTINSYDQTTMNNFQRDDGSATVSGLGNRYFYVIFPRLMDISHMYIGAQFNAGAGGGAWWSADTTTGINGTWTTIPASGWWHSGNGSTAVSKISTRTEMGAVSLTGVKGIRWLVNTGGGSSAACNAHFYGKPNAGADTDRLELWHPTLDQRVGPAYFDWGDPVRGTTQTLTFRVKNRSSTLTANSINLTIDARTDTTPTFISQHTFSPDGTTFTSSLNIGNLAPGATSGVLHFRRSLLSTAGLALWWARIRAAAGSWT